MTNAAQRLLGRGNRRCRPTESTYRVTPYGYRALNAAISVHDHSFPADYLAAA